MTLSGVWSRYRRARPPKPSPLGRWQHVLADALDQNLAIGVRATVADHLGRSPTRAELTAARRAPTNARLANARRQQQLASLLAEAQRLHRAGQWAALIKIGEQLQAIDPAAADPDGLITSARAELAAEQQAARLGHDHHTGLHLINAGRWAEAAEALERVTRLDSTYKNAPALLNRARHELAQAAKPLEQQARRQAEARSAPVSSATGVRRPPGQREVTRKSRAASNGQQRHSAPSQKHPHGTMILIFGSLGMFVPILAPIAWYLGNKANNEIQSSGIHYTEEQNISVGRMLGKIFTIIAASAIVLWVVIAAVEAIQGS